MRSGGQKRERQIACLVAIGLACMCRPGELVSLQIDSISFHSDTKGMDVDLGITKTDQLGRDTTVPVHTSGTECCPVQLTRDWIGVRHAQGARGPDPLFVSSRGYRLSRDAVSRIVREVAESEGVNLELSGHSLRIGGATEAAHQGVPVDIIKSIGRWKSDSGVMRYIRALAGQARRSALFFRL